MTIAKILAGLVGLFNALLARSERKAEREDGARQEREEQRNADDEANERARRMSAAVDDPAVSQRLRDIFAAKPPR